MKEDMRVCPVCKKYPPIGQEWVDFEAHRRGCGITKPSEESDPFEKVFGKESAKAYKDFMGID